MLNMNVYAANTAKTSNPSASAESRCADVFAACDKALGAKDEVIKKQGDAIDFLSKEHDRLTKPKQFYEEPWFWLVIGVVAGAGAAGLGMGLGR